MALGHTRHMGEMCMSPYVDLHTSACVDMQHSDFGCLQVKLAVGPSSKPVSRGGAHRCSSLLVFLLSKVLTLNGPIALTFLFCFVFCFLGSLQTPCQQELDQVLERISTMRLPDERGPLEHLYSLHIPNCDKHGLYNLKQVSVESQSPGAGCTRSSSHRLSVRPHHVQAQRTCTAQGRADVTHMV